MSASDSRINHFLLLTVEERKAAIARLAQAGYSDYTIASICRLAVEQVRQILGEQRALEESQP